MPNAVEKLDEDTHHPEAAEEARALRELDAARPQRRKGQPPQVGQYSLGRGEPVGPTRDRALPRVAPVSSELADRVRSFEHDPEALLPPAVNARVALADGRVLVGRVLGADERKVFFRPWGEWGKTEVLELRRKDVTRAALFPCGYETREIVSAHQRRGGSF